MDIMKYEFSIYKRTIIIKAQMDFLLQFENIKFDFEKKIIETC